MIVLDLSKDWKLIDNPENILYVIKASEGAYYNATPVSGVYWEETTQYDFQTQSLLQQQERHAHLWTPFLFGASGSFLPKMDDMIFDSLNNQWIVTGTEGLDLDANGIQRWRVKTLLSPGSSSGLVSFSGFPPPQGFFTGTIGGP